MTLNELKEEIEKTPDYLRDLPIDDEIDITFINIDSNPRIRLVAPPIDTEE